MAKKRTNASNTGKAFEKEIGLALLAYRSMDVARFEKTDPPVRMVRTRGSGTRTIQMQNPWLDWAGCWHGRSVLIEAKSTKTPKTKTKAECWLTLRATGAGLTERQTEETVDWTKFGALVIIMFKLDDEVKLYLGDQVRDTDEVGIRRIYWNEGIECDRNPMNGLLDPLGTIEQTLWGKV